MFHSYVKLPEGTIVRQPQNPAVLNSSSNDPVKPRHASFSGTVAGRGRQSSGLCVAEAPGFDMGSTDLIRENDEWPMDLG